MYINWKNMYINLYIYQYIWWMTVTLHGDFLWLMLYKIDLCLYYNKDVLFCNKKKINYLEKKWRIVKTYIVICYITIELIWKYYFSHFLLHIFLSRKVIFLNLLIFLQENARCLSIINLSSNLLMMKNSRHLTYAYLHAFIKKF